jgi:hypothetical protein
LNMQCTAPVKQQQVALATIVGDAAGQPAAPLENRALAKTLSVERVQMARNCDSDKLLSSAVANTQPSSEIGTQGEDKGNDSLPVFNSPRIPRPNRP